MTDALTVVPLPAERILVVETLYLGDLVHTLPLLQAIRRRFPAARLDVLVRMPHVALMRHVAGIDQILGMDPKEHRGLRGLWQLCQTLRRQHYDLVINPGASDRATILTALSGGGQRIGRLNRNQSRWLWPLLHDQVIDHAWAAEPMYWQKLRAFRQPLQLDAEVHFGLDPKAIDLERVLGARPHIHVSPLASEDLRCLPPALLLELAALLRQRFPQYDLIVSCGPSTREVERLGCVRPALESLGVRCLVGEVDLPTLAAIIGRAALHIGPDSGPLHLAVAQGTPAIACFLFKDASAEWMPVGLQYRTVGVDQRFQGGLYGLSVGAVVEAANQLLEG